MSAHALPHVFRSNGFTLDLVEIGSQAELDALLAQWVLEGRPFAKVKRNGRVSYEECIEATPFEVPPAEVAPVEAAEIEKPVEPERVERVARKAAKADRLTFENKKLRARIAELEARIAAIPPREKPVVPSAPSVVRVYVGKSNVPNAHRQ